MQTDTMDVINKFVQSDPSFAGFGAYYSQAPRKVFMGEAQGLPAAVIASALDQMQSGGASPKQKMDAKKAMQPTGAPSMSQSCLACVTSQKDCLKSGDMSSCIKKATDCLQQNNCPSVGGKGMGKGM